MADPDIVDAVDPEEAFATLADPTRIAALQALWEAEDHEASFSELREAVGVEDSGRFNYHLGKLVGQFVDRTDDGYRLRLAGVRVVGSLLAGAYTKAGTVDPVPVDEPCPSCGSAMTFRYEDDWVNVGCDDCEITTRFGTPPGVFAGYDADALPAVAERYVRTIMQGARNGFCPYCQGRFRPTVVPAAVAFDEPGPEPPARLRNLPMVQYDCERCGDTMVADLGTALLDHPAVVSFYHDHGVDVREDSLWRFTAVREERASIQETEPMRAAVGFEADGDRLRLTVDGALDVLDAED